MPSLDMLNNFSILDAIQLIAIGLAVGSYGTLIGAGGGFILVPVLLLIYPDIPPSGITAMSLTVVFFNSYAGTWAYARMGRIDYANGIMYATAGIPGAILGTWVVTYIATNIFSIALGSLLLCLSAYLIYQPMRGARFGKSSAGKEPTPADKDNRYLGAVSSAYLGLVSSLLGIGGGTLHVPFLIRFLDFPPHSATATSHFVLVLVTFSATVSHMIRGELDTVLIPTAFLALGVMLGAPIGATFSSKLRGPWLVRLLALALFIVAIRILWR